jgi:hypothetical protein
MLLVPSGFQLWRVSIVEDETRPLLCLRIRRTGRTSRTVPCGCSEVAGGRISGEASVWIHSPD